MTNRPAAFAPDSQATTAYVSVRDTLRHLHGEYMLYTNTRLVTEHGTVMWPAGGTFVIHMTGLPQDEAELMHAIRQSFETVDKDGRILFPIKYIRIDHRTDEIRIIGDERRAHMMRPMPN